MKKINILWIILDLIFLIIFNTIFFMVGGVKHLVSVWVSYGFIHFAYLMLILTPFLIRKSRSAAVFGFSLYSISAVYFLIEFVTGIVFIFVASESNTAAILVQLCIAGLYGIILVSNLIANEHTANAEEKRQAEIAFVKDASVKLKELMEKTGDKEAKKKIERVYDAVYSSPVKSHPTLSELETGILQSIDRLAAAVSGEQKEDIASATNSLLSAVNGRNMRLRALQ